MLKQSVIFDLDGTLADRRHRLHFLQGKKDWKAFFENMHLDPPVEKVFERLFFYFNQDYKIIILTGRPEEYRKVTISWLKENKVKPSMYEMFMRETKNYESDVSLK